MKKSTILLAAIASLTIVSWSLDAQLDTAPVAQTESHVDSIGLDFSTEDSFNFESEEFQKMLEQLQTHIEEMKRKMPEEEVAAFDAMENEMKALGEKLSKLKTELAEYEHQKSSYKKEVLELREQLAGLEKDKADLTAVIEKLSQKSDQSDAVDLQESGLEIPAEDELAHKHEVLAEVDSKINEAKQQLEEKRAAKREVKAREGDINRKSKRIYSDLFDGFYQFEFR
jgi:chromosome segregation ATPase